jgi:endonuclease G
MNPRQRRLVDYIRQLSGRDQVGPEAFEIKAEDLETESPSGAGPTRSIAPKRSPDLIQRKKIESLTRGLTGDTAIVAPAPAEQNRGVATSARATPGLTPQAAEAFDRALRNQPLSSDDLVHLESIVLPALRPVFDIQNESYAALPAVWDPLNQQRATIEPLIRGIGRLQLTGHPSFTLVGTGFICGPNAILTNRHVAQIFVQQAQAGGQLSFIGGVTCAMEMLGEVASPSTLTLDVRQPICISTTWDVAMLRVNTLPAGIAPLPLASSSPASLNGGFAAIVGYPSFDPVESFIDQANIFRSIFDRKRLQPGKINGRADVASFGRNVSAVAHDCSTLGGNSGSALISADDAKVVGIHFSGLTHVSNFAVPVWELANDAALAGQSLNFV